MLFAQFSAETGLAARVRKNKADVSFRMFSSTLTNGRSKAFRYRAPNFNVVVKIGEGGIW
jgi:hypothetical protein